MIHFILSPGACLGAKVLPVGEEYQIVAHVLKGIFLILNTLFFSHIQQLKCLNCSFQATSSGTRLAIKENVLDVVLDAATAEAEFDILGIQGGCNFLHY